MLASEERTKQKENAAEETGSGVLGTIRDGSLASVMKETELSRWSLRSGEDSPGVHGEGTGSG